ncbi:hypothetical protein BSPWISOX_3009 [uncultured Gammaproteobacteria bacterium]|nr:hypothetical protein BSPWISOX_3009 [uncultured Gammaproteobacteria bacterium]
MMCWSYSHGYVHAQQVSVAGCLGYDVLDTDNLAKIIQWCVSVAFQLLVV